MTITPFTTRFTDAILQQLLPPERADAFFDAMYGAADEGAYDISLACVGHDEAAATLTFAFTLTERPGKCLACNLTHGLPEVFARHPIINVKGLVAAIQDIIGNQATCGDWSLGRTQTVAKDINTIPLVINLDGLVTTQL